jgi:quinol monooxygenase YgiN
LVVRVSKGRYRPELHAEVTVRLDASAKSLVPAIRAMPGCLSYCAGSDATTNTMVNVSVWDLLEHAQAMGSLPEMAALAKDFIAPGVEFERPIANYPVLWQLQDVRLRSPASFDDPDADRRGGGASHE